ncbi:LuxS/MPP-like metallohydrolase [Auriculariales sp. MPI-PUGE-AT-0066]|nr:LuxS/MPP-like metallohydrolase [Auriculariales sp. MPI-PUGE-AT-0066]
MLVKAASASRAGLSRYAVRRLATVVDAPGFKISAVDRGEPVTSITVVAKAGSRFEAAPGLAHIFKNFAFKTNSNQSALKTIRMAELYGGILSSSLSREHISFTAEFLRGEEKHFAAVLADSLSSTRYSRHELEEDVLPIVASESAEANVTPELKALDLAHTLAFRTGLGASLYAGEHPHASEEALREYARSAFSKGNVAVVGQGISADSLTSIFAPHLKDVAAPTSKASVYHGGETRIAGTAGAAAPELDVLANYLSPTPSVKWSTGTGPLAANIPIGASVEMVLYNYSDAALFGFLVQAETAETVAAAAKAIVAGIKAISSKAPESSDLKAAIAKSRFRAAQAVEGRTGFATVTGTQLLGGSTDLEKTLSSLAGVQAAAVTKAAATLTKAKPTYVAIGNLHKLPHADEVGL